MEKTFHIATKVWGDCCATTGKFPDADQSLQESLKRFLDTCPLEKIFFVQISDAEQSSPPNIAVAIINEPTFVRKSSVLLQFLQQRVPSMVTLSNSSLSTSSLLSQSGIPRIQLTFLTGMDTLVRLFAPRYYVSEEAMRYSLHHFLSEEGDDSRIICARRASQGISPEEERVQECRILDTVKAIVQSARVMLVDMSERERSISSTCVRQSIARGDEVWKELVVPEIAAYISGHNLYRS